MSSKNSVGGIRGFIVSWYHELFGGSKDDFKYVKELIIGVAILAVGTGAYFGYRWYSIGRDEAAQRLFAQNIDEFERVLQEGKKEDWAAIASLFQLGYDQYPNSSLAPYFLAYKAEATLKEGSISDAVPYLGKAISEMPKSSPVYYLYKVKLALMHFDLANYYADNKEKSEGIIKSGIEQLQAIAEDKNNLAQDVAGYHLGLYYWSNDNLDKAKEVWQALVEATKTERKQGESPWAAKAQEKLAQIA